MLQGRDEAMVNQTSRAVAPGAVGEKLSVLCSSGKPSRPRLRACEAS